ncbi:MAG: hypothetical protein R3B57_09050 [Phycisphaerales bacterium]
MGYVIAAFCVLVALVGAGLVLLPTVAVLGALAASQVIALAGASATGRALAQAAEAGSFGAE